MTSFFNLLREQWIPARRQSGDVEWIAPWQVTEELDSNPFISIAAPRPDFNGALTEFLIGLLATATAPEDEEAWRESWRSPPPPEALKKDFEEYVHAFDLDGDSSRFMQDFDPLDKGNKEPVTSLFMDSPGQQTLRQNADLFVKREQMTLCRATAAMALYTLQTYAPAGGAGHRTSLRGGGPLTTLLVSDRNGIATLWGRLWPNVPTKEEIKVGNYARNSDADIFPWLQPTRTSQKQGGRETTPDDAHPLQMFWGMPRRIRLDFYAADGGGICSLTQREDTVVIRTYRTVNYGINYSEGWKHFLSPYYRQSEKTGWFPRHAGINGVSYRHWLGFTANGRESSKPAFAVGEFRRSQALRREGNPRLVAFGYDMDNMKARAWLESEMPVFVVSSGAKEVVEASAERMVKAAEIVAGATKNAIKKALFQNPQEVRGDFSFISDCFWRSTGKEFFDTLDGIAEWRESHEMAEIDASYKKWLNTLKKKSLVLFDEYAPAEGVELSNMKRLVKAWKSLDRNLRGYGGTGRKLFEALDLPVPKTKSKRS